MYRAISTEKLLKIAKLQRMQNRSAAGRLKIAHDSTDGEENLCFDDAIRALRETLANQLLCCRCMKTTSPSVTARCVLFPAPRVLLTQATLQEALGGMLAVEPGGCTTGTRKHHLAVFRKVARGKERRVRGKPWSTSTSPPFF